MPPAIDLQQLAGLERIGPEPVGLVVNLVLTKAVNKSASDVHFEPTHRSLEIRFRLDGVLHTVAALNREIAANIVARLKVLAELLTYRLDVPKEGRLVDAVKTFGVDMRFSTLIERYWA